MDPAPVQSWGGVDWGMPDAYVERTIPSFFVFGRGDSYLFYGIARKEEVTLVLNALSPSEVGEILGTIGYSLRRAEVQDEEDEEVACLVVRNRLVALRLPLLDTSAFLASILNSFHHLTHAPCLRLDLPFSLLPSLLETILPTLTSILQHPSLPIARDTVLQSRGLTKRIIIGTHSLVDANALRGKIEELGELEVPVEVDVLEL